ncbi:hypothetical protein SDC9_39146 [bioreactor metagenome]|uniref:Uncharacterized protein n=1 Tax=bioreactor metagenome TaxID=1076179 RepID=A0A644VR79_9ZZZZ
MPHDRVILERIDRHVLAIARLLQPAMRHLVGQHEMGVHPGAAVLQPRGDREALAHVLGPDRRRQPIVRVIRPADRLFRLVEAGDRDDGAKDLAPDDLVRLQGAGDDGRLVEEALALGDLAAGRNLDVVLFAGAGDEGGDPVALARRNQRPHLVQAVVLVAEADGRDRGGEVRHEFLVDARLRIDPAGGGAVLPGVVIAEGAQARDGRLDIGIVEQDHRRLAAQFQMRALDRAGRGLEHLAPGRDVAGERNHRHLRVVDERRTHGLATAKDDVDDPLGQHLGEDPRHRQRGQRRLFRGLEDHGVTRTDRRGDLPRHHHQRIVPGRDRGDDADRVAPDHRGVARQVLARDRPVHGAHGAREEAEAVDDRRQLVAERHVPGLAAVERLEPGERRRLGLDLLGDLQQIARAGGRRGARPGGEGLRRGPDRRLDLRERGLGKGDNHLAGAGVEDLFLGLGARNEVGADQHLRLHGGLPVSHFSEPAVFSPSLVR